MDDFENDSKRLITKLTQVMISDPKGINIL